MKERIIEEEKSHLDTIQGNFSFWKLKISFLLVRTRAWIRQNFINFNHNDSNLWKAEKTRKFTNTHTHKVALVSNWIQNGGVMFLFGAVYEKRIWIKTGVCMINFMILKCSRISDKESVHHHPSCLIIAQFICFKGLRRYVVVYSLGMHDTDKEHTHISQLIAFVLISIITKFCRLSNAI